MNISKKNLLLMLLGVVIAILSGFIIHVKVGNYFGPIVAETLQNISLPTPPYKTSINVIAAIYPRIIKRT